MYDSLWQLLLGNIYIMVHHKTVSFGTHLHYGTSLNTMVFQGGTLIASASHRSVLIDFFSLISQEISQKVCGDHTFRLLEVIPEFPAL